MKNRSNEEEDDGKLTLEDAENNYYYLRSRCGGLYLNFDGANGKRNE